jgi:haloalkane dehalogenase
MAEEEKEKTMLRQLPTVSEVLRTPEECFADIPDFPYSPHYIEVGCLRIAYIDEGPQDAPIVLLMHGEPTWSYLYRKMIPVLLKAGYRTIAPDLVGFGRSDKPASPSDYSYANHVLWMSAWLVSLDLHNVTLFCQDWGSLIGLRVVAEEPDRFDRIVLANGALPTGTEPVPLAFQIWRAFAIYSPYFPIGHIIHFGTTKGLNKDEVAAYDAPFPSTSHQVGARLFPTFWPTSSHDSESKNNERAWQVFNSWRKPFLTLFSDNDPITRGIERVWQRNVPGAQGQPHAITLDAGHFLQEDKGDELANKIIEFIQANKN